MDGAEMGRPIRGMDLRYVLAVQLFDGGGSRTVHELLAALAASGFFPPGRASKAVSDALRWEVRKGRVVRLGRGVYGPGVMPRSTQWWIRNRIAAL